MVCHYFAMAQEEEGVVCCYSAISSSPPPPLPGRGSPLPLLSRSLKGSSTSRPGDLPSMPLSSSPSGRPLERKGLPECFPEKFKPAHSVSGYNRMGVAGDKPGSVMSMRVVF